jgi:hypothetical protein
MHLQFAPTRNHAMSNIQDAHSSTKKKMLNLSGRIDGRVCCNKLETVMDMLQSELTDAAAKHERQQNEDGRDEQHELSPRPPPRAEQLPQHAGVLVASHDAAGHHVPCAPRNRGRALLLSQQFIPPEFSTSTGRIVAAAYR